MLTQIEIVNIIKPILKAKSRSFSKSLSTYGVDDIESELWVHVFENMPRFENLLAKDIKALAKVMLKNRAISLYRKQGSYLKRKASLDDCDLCFDDILSLEMSFLGLKIFDKSSFNISQDGMYQYKELVAIIEKWALTQDPISQRLIKEMVDPSDATIDMWYSFKENSPKCKPYEYIPSCSFQRILGISRPKILRVMKNLRAYLTEVYSLSCSEILDCC